jgi:carboxylesterase
MKEPFGVLIFPGFAENADCTGGLELMLQEQGLPARVPMLRGHGAASPQVLHGVTWQDWMVDAEAAFQDMRLAAEKLILVGHSMGALAALMLAAGHAREVDSIVLVAPAIRMASSWAPGQPLHVVAPVLARLLPRQSLAPAFADHSLAHSAILYPWVPADALAQALEFSQTAQRRLADVQAPALILHSHRDTVAFPESANIVLAGISTPREWKRILWFDKTDHIMFCDCEKEAVMGAVIAYIGRRCGVCSEGDAQEQELIDTLWGAK